MKATLDGSHTSLSLFSLRIFTPINHSCDTLCLSLKYVYISKIVACDAVSSHSITFSHFPMESHK